MGWCLEREDYRLFKLNRMDCVTESEQFFMCRNVPMPNLSNEKIFPGGIKVKVLFAPDVSGGWLKNLDRIALPGRMMEGCFFRRIIQIWKTL